MGDKATKIALAAPPGERCDDVTAGFCIQEALLPVPHGSAAALNENDTAESPLHSDAQFGDRDEGHPGVEAAAGAARFCNPRAFGDVSFALL
jgi:hypothetical protein